MSTQRKLFELFIAGGAFAAFAGLVWLTDAPRGIVLPTWIGVTLALAARTYGRACVDWIAKGTHYEA